MESFLSFLQPYILSFKMYGIWFGYDNENAGKLKKFILSGQRWAIRLLMLGMLTQAAYSIEVVVDSYSSIQKDKRERATYDSSNLTTMMTGLVISSNALSYAIVYFNYKSSNFAVLKTILMKDSDRKQMHKRCCLPLTILLVQTACICVAIPFRIYDITSTALNSVAQSNEESIIEHHIYALANACFYLLQFLIAHFILYFECHCCFLLYVISNFVDIRLDAIFEELKQIKSATRMIRRMDEAFEEYRQLQHLAKIFNDLFAPVAFITCIANLMNFAILFALPLYVDPKVVLLFMLNDFYSYSSFTYLCIYIWTAIKVNKKQRQFSKCLIPHLLSNNRLPLDLSIKRLDHLYEIVHLRWFEQNLFNMSYVEIDEMLVFTIFGQLYDRTLAMTALADK